MGPSPDIGHLCPGKNIHTASLGGSQIILAQVLCSLGTWQVSEVEGKKSSISAEREILSKIAPAAGGHESGANTEPNQTRSVPTSLVHHFNEHPDLVATNKFMFTARYKEMRTELQKLFMYVPDLLGIGTEKCLSLLRH